MRKRLLAVLLAVCMTVACLPTALAAEAGKVRDTNFFTDQEHADVNYEDMAYEEMYVESFETAAKEIGALLDDGANAAQVEKLFTAFTDDYQKLDTMYSLISIQYSHDVTDEYAAEEAVRLDTVYYEVADILVFLIQDILESDCGAFLRAQLSDADIGYYMSYTGTTDEQKAMSARETELTLAYDNISQTFTVRYDGMELDLYDARDLYSAGEIEYEEYVAIVNQYTKGLAEAVGSIYLELVALRNEIAQSCGYDNYVDYAYEMIYGRDYSPEEIRDYAEAVKEYIPDIEYVENSFSYYFLPEEVEYADYTGDIALDMIEPYIGQMSSELLEPFTYMRDHNLYDSADEGNKDGTGYTTVLSSYGAPFFFNTPTGNLYDFTTAVHEFGHYNNFYWHPSGWNDEWCNYDSAEVHSQGLELMFSHWYPEIFGEDSQAVLDYQIDNLLYAIIDGAMFDEWQQYVYTTEDLTLDDINAECLRLSVEYGMAEEGAGFDDYYSGLWAMIPHNFGSPVYYISYSVSAAGAFAFWLDAQEEGYFAALDKYLEFVALPASTSFQESFEKVGLEDPVSPAYIKELAATLVSALDMEQRIAEDVYGGTYFSDVSYLNGDWYYDAVQMVAALGLMEGVGGDRFAPNGTATRSMAVTTLYRLLGDEEEYPTIFTDVVSGSWYEDAANWAGYYDVAEGNGNGSFYPNSVITREQFAAMLYRLTDGEEVSGDLSAFRDADAVSPWAKDAMSWCVNNGIIEGDGDMLKPGRVLKRTELAMMLYNLVVYILSQMEDVETLSLAPIDVEDAPIASMPEIRLPVRSQMIGK